MSPSGPELRSGTGRLPSPPDQRGDPRTGAGLPGSRARGYAAVRLTRHPHEETRMNESPILYPEDRIPLPRLVPMGLQHVVAMFGATVLAPVIMNFDPQLAIFFSGVGTLIFLATTRLKVPSYLGSSFSFIGPVLAVTGGDPALIPNALCGISAAAVLYAIAAWA